MYESVDTVESRWLNHYITRIIKTSDIIFSEIKNMVLNFYDVTIKN
jgi:hypothetical protein